VDVKGDTRMDFVVPFASPLDWYSHDPTGTPAYITCRLYDKIATVDGTADPTIDLNVWVAAGPDCQFAVPFVYRFEVVNRSTWFSQTNYAPPEVREGRVPATKREATFNPGRMVDRSLYVHKQSDILEDFKYEFEPFVMGCEYLVDNHYVMSETTEYVTDILKRYQSTTPTIYSAALSIPVNALPIDYVPDPGTLGAQIVSAFMFYRGGTSYKLIAPKITTNNVTSGTFTVRQGDPVNAWTIWLADGSATIMQLDAQDCMDVSVPYHCQFPYLQQGMYLACLPDPLPGMTTLNNYQAYGMYRTTTLGSNNVFYTAVRDDFALGFLRFPTHMFAPLTAERKEPRWLSGLEDFEHIAMAKPKSAKS